MKRNILIGLLSVSLVYCFTSHLEELRYVPEGTVGVIRDAAGTVSESVVKPGRVWLWGGQGLALYRTTPIDATIPARQLRGAYDGRATPALGLIYRIDAARAAEFRSHHPDVHQSLRRDDRGMILPGFYAVVEAMRTALNQEKELPLPRQGGADLMLVQDRLRRIAVRIKQSLALRFGETFQVTGAWVAAPGFKRIAVDLEW